MDEGRPVDTLQTTTLYQSGVFKGGESAVTQSGMSTMEADELGRKAVMLQWEESPERTVSLLPPFGVDQSSHLPTPQSPGNFANYISGPAGSPLSPEYSRPPPTRHLTTLRPPSRPTSANPPQTPPRGPSGLAFRGPSLSSAPGRMKDSSSHPLEELDSASLPPSQIATPSPEVFRSQRASIANPFSASGTMFATPQAGSRSSPHPYTAPATLASAISPANSSHSTIYQTLPEFEGEELEQPDLTYNFSRDMAVLVSDHNAQAAERDQEFFDSVDPFVVCSDRDREDPFSRQRYPSPRPSKHRQHCSTHDNASPHISGGTGCRTPLADSIAKLVMSPSEFSEAPSHDSPAKAEVEQGDEEVPMDLPRSPTADRTTFSCNLISPRTPPPAGSNRAPALEPQTQQEDSVFGTPPPAPGGEIERIRQRQAVAEERRLAESEKRRPEYLMRVKRARDKTEDELAERERENELPGLDVTISPSRGRRLKLYQPVALASNATLAHEVETGAVEEPKTPPPLNTASTNSAVPSWQTSAPSMPLRAIDWRTPRPGRSSPVISTKENELKKQKRLQAFVGPQIFGKGRRVKPVEVLGRGRAVVDVASEKTRELAEAGLIRIPEAALAEPVDIAELAATGHGADWPDKEYPWSVQEKQRNEYKEAERRRRLVWIERFLDRDSESEDEDNECVAGPSARNQTFDVGSVAQPQRGSGKSIFLNAAPNSKRSAGGHRIAIGAANADAHVVLLSKKYVRAAAERIRKRKIAEEEEGVVMCICQGADDGRPMVRCDECRTWYHLICMDIHDESELGEEWYCWKCLPSTEDPPPAISFEPTFAPTMPESPPRAGVGDQLLFMSALQPSPMPPSPMAQRTRERSPRRLSRLPHSLGDPGDPVRGGPSTPYRPRTTESRLYSTPRYYDEEALDEIPPFDPTSTPSRGLSLLPLSPRRPHTWGLAQPLPWMTPSGPPRTPQFSTQSGSSSTRSLAYSLSTLEDSAGPLTSPWREDESPTRKPHKTGDSMWPPTNRRLFESPLTMRSTAHRSFLPGVEDSPTRRSFPRGKESEIADLSSRASLMRSPYRD